MAKILKDIASIMLKLSQKKYCSRKT